MRDDIQKLKRKGYSFEKISEIIDREIKKGRYQEKIRKRP